MIPDEQPENPRATIGDNSGDILETAQRELREKLYHTEIEGSGKTFAQRRDELLLSMSRQTVTNRQSAADAGDTIKIAKEVWEKIDAERRAITDPHYAVHKTLSGVANEFWSGVIDAMQVLAAGIDAYADLEQQRVEQQRREQQEAMAAMRAPAAPRSHIDYSAPEPTPQRVMPAMRQPRRDTIRGDLGATISTRQQVDYVVEDPRLLPDHVLNSPVVQDAIIAFVKATAKHMGVPAGVRAVARTKAQIS